MMKDFRKVVLRRSSLLVWISFSLSLIGRVGFDRGVWRHGIMGAAAGVLSVAMVVLFLDVRKGSEVCPLGDEAKL